MLSATIETLIQQLDHQEEQGVVTVSDSLNTHLVILYMIFTNQFHHKQENYAWTCFCAVIISPLVTISLFYPSRGKIHFSACSQSPKQFFLFCKRGLIVRFDFWTMKYWTIPVFLIWCLYWNFKIFQDRNSLG